MIWKYKEENLLANRKAESDKIFKKYPDRIPIIVEKVPHSQVPDIDKHKYLVPIDITVAQLIWIIRKRIRIEAEKSLSIFVGEIIPNTSITLNQLYKEHKDEDGFLYLCYSGENTFGSQRLVKK